MSDSSNALLQRAYSHIENDELEKAQEILAPLLQDDASNAHLWWVYTHAVNDASIGQAALERVLALDPRYPGARELKADVLEAQSNDPDLIAFETGEAGADYTASPIGIDEWEDLQPAVEPTVESASSRMRLIIAAVLLIAIAGGVIVISGEIDLDALLTGVLPSPAARVIVVSESTREPTDAALEDEAMAAPEATAAALELISEAGEPELTATDREETGAITRQEATPLETAESTPLETAETTPLESAEATPLETAESTPLESTESTPLETAEATAAATAQATPSPAIDAGSSRVRRFIGMVADEIAEFAIDRSTSGTLPTALGNTLVIRVCAVPGPEYNARLDTVLTTVVDLADRLPEAIEAVSAGLLNCGDDEASLRIIGVSRETAEAFANDEIEDKEFQRAWQPLS